MLVNILALIYGAVMIVNIALWAAPELFGDFGGEGRNIWNPPINGLFEVNGQTLDGLPAWPLFETLVGPAPRSPARSTTRSPSAAARPTSRPTRSPAKRPSADHPPEPHGRRVRRGERSPRRIMSAMTEPA